MALPYKYVVFCNILNHHTITHYRIAFGIGMKKTNERMNWTHQHIIKQEILIHWSFHAKLQVTTKYFNENQIAITLTIYFFNISR